MNRLANVLGTDLRNEVNGQAKEQVNGETDAWIDNGIIMEWSREWNRLDRRTNDSDDIRRVERADDAKQFNDNLDGGDKDAERCILGDRWESTD